MHASTPRLVVIDCETTGLGQHDRIVEITALTLNPQTWEPVDEYDTLINPERDVGPIEASFADQLEKNTAVKVYAKLPGWFAVPTPLGSYNPDWRS